MAKTFSNVGRILPPKGQTPIDPAVIKKDTVMIRDLSTTVSDVDFPLPIRIARKYQVHYSCDRHPDTNERMVQIMLFTKEKKGRYKGRIKITTLVRMREKVFKKMYGVPLSDNVSITAYKTFDLNIKKLPPFFDVLP